MRSIREMAKDIIVLVLQYAEEYPPTKESYEKLTDIVVEFILNNPWKDEGPTNA